MKAKNFVLHAALILSSLFSVNAYAQVPPGMTCDSVLYDYSLFPDPAYVQQYPECFGASQQTATVSINLTSFVQITTISTALSNRFLASPPPSLAGLSSGRAAATPGKQWNVWGNLTSNTTEQNNPVSTVKTDTDALTTVVGGDYALSPTMAAGVSVAFDRASGDSRLAGAVQNSLLNEGYMVAPYIGVSLSKEMALDASLGLGQGKLSQSGGIAADADRWFAGVNLNYARWMGNTQVSGKFGWMHGEEKYDNAVANGVAFAGTGAKNKIDQWRLGAQASWWMNGVMPYVGLTYLAENRSTTLAGASDPIGKDAWLASVGANFMSLSSGMTGGVVYEQEFSRSNQDNYRLIANIGLRF